MAADPCKIVNAPKPTSVDELVGFLSCREHARVVIRYRFTFTRNDFLGIGPDGKLAFYCLEDGFAYYVPNGPLTFAQLEPTFDDGGFNAVVSGFPMEVFYDNPIRRTSGLPSRYEED